MVDFKPDQNCGTSLRQDLEAFLGPLDALVLFLLFLLFLAQLLFQLGVAHLQHHHLTVVLHTLLVQTLVWNTQWAALSPELIRELTSCTSLDVMEETGGPGVNPRKWRENVPAHWDSESLDDTPVSFMMLFWHMKHFLCFTCRHLNSPTHRVFPLRISLMCLRP